MQKMKEKYGALESKLDEERRSLFLHHEGIIVNASIQPVFKQKIFLL